jgi:serine/threonine-protein kinase
VTRPNHEQLVGRTIAGKFVVEGLIGSGAMGAVFRARQVALEKTVAIKVLHGEHAADPAFAARFHREAKAASRLNHPNSMQVLDFGAEPDGLLYIAMEYLDGRSLHRLMRDEGRLGSGRIADILMQALAALAVAHDMGVVHRDLKPENVMVLRGTDDDGRPRDIVKVCDFGIAKITDSRAYRSGERESNAPVTTAGFLVGTPEYMSPEQGRGDKLDARSDLYSIGVMLYEMLTGHVPFQAENAIGVVLKHVTDAPVRPSSVIAGVEPRLEAICLRALRKSPDDRYQGAREMRGELRLVAEGQATSAGGADSASDPVPAAPPALEQAATLQVSRRVAATIDEPSGKPTLQGTSTAVPRTSRPRRLLLATAAVALVAGLVTTALVLVVARSRPRLPPPAAAPTEAPQTAIEALPVGPATIPDVEPADPVSRAGGAAAHAPPRSSHGGISSAPSGKAAPPGAAGSAGSASGLPGPAGLATVASVAQPAPNTPGGPPPLSPLPAPDPSFDPETGYVEVGLINAQGVREQAVRGALHGAGLAVCYRTALRTHGARATGVAQLSLSIDENGATRSAIATGADFLPGLARCVQAAAARLSVPASRVDPSGGTAEITLAFKAPP